ncbi:hypothetical protein ACFSUS_25120 [Spirosoma soli]|uniref:Curlin n=1 Tax=Spirosoma soli TaxID=1770529 RepID=A0ABW5MCE7_9BACT
MIRCIFWLLAFFCPVLSWAQGQTPSEALWKPGVQLSDETQAILSQLTAGQAGTGELGDINISQTGTNNGVRLTGSGAGNRLNFSQDGNNNQLSLELNGNQNTFTLGQLGNNNTLDLRNVQTNGEQLDILQRGNGNRLSSDGYPFATGVPIKVEQSGGMQVQITNVR